MFELSYLAEIREKPSTIKQESAYNKINKGLWNYIFVECAEEPSCKNTFDRIKTEIDKTRIIKQYIP